MKIVKLTEKIKNLDKVVTNDHINAVTEMPPAMSDAYENSIEKDEYDNKVLEDADALPKDKPFIGAEDQPVPDKPVEAKINLDESLFEAMGSRAAIYDDIVDFVSDKINDALDNISIEVMEAIPDYNADWCRSDFNIVTGNKQLILAKAVADDLMTDCDLVESLNENQNINLPGYAVEWISGYAGNGANNRERKYFRTEEEQDSFVDELNSKNVQGIKKWIQPDFYHTLPEDYKASPEDSDKMWAAITRDDLLDKGRNNWDETDWDAYYALISRGEIKEECHNEECVEESCHSAEEVEESCDKEPLEEDGRSQSLLRQLDDTDIEEEEFDLWTLVYSSLINKPDEATWKAMQRFDTVVLPKKLRYETINTDTDGNIVVYGKDEKDLDGAKLVADLYELEYEIKPARDSWAKIHPDQRFSLTIKIPEEEVTDIDKYFKK